MAKKCKIAKEKQRAAKVERFTAKRKELKAIISNINSTPEEIEEAYIKLRKLPRDINPIRMRNRCAVTGRPRGFIRRVGLSRISFREMAVRGLLPGVVRSSW